MAEQYPASLPKPLLNGYGFAVASGVIRSGTDTDQAQRRVFDTMPHTFTLSFLLTVSEWWTWSQWVADYGHGWFEIDIPTLYAGRIDLNVSTVLVRLISGVSAEAIGQECIRASVAAELAPSAIAAYLEEVL
jgi:hypothetical protein